MEVLEWEVHSGSILFATFNFCSKKWQFQTANRREKSKQASVLSNLQCSKHVLQTIVEEE